MKSADKEQFYGRSKETCNLLFYILWMTALWNVEKFEFPLNPFLEKFQIKYSHNFERLLVLVCGITGMDKVLTPKFVREATVVAGENPQWDEEAVWLYLALLANNRELPPLTFSDIKIFRQEIKLIFLKVLQEYTTQLLDTRSACNRVISEEPLAPLSDSLAKFYREIFLLLPENTGLEPYNEVLKKNIDNWLQKGYVEKPDFKRVIEELLG